ncbi:MAG: hypothetical protein GY805_27255 [Chloroflexi bacterium]|nr:hypothetical protein [Chloroflexota bacterium]
MSTAVMNGRKIGAFLFSTKTAPLMLWAILGVLALAAGDLPSGIPSRDSGVFLYAGQRILDGQIPYRDVWDHKGPLLYYINALGLFIGQGTIWGVWILEYLALGTAVVTSFQLLKQAFGKAPAIAGATIWLINASLLQIGENLSEEYTLPLQFAALYLFWRSRTSEKAERYFFAIGLTLAAAFLLRPNNIGTHLSIIVYVVWSSVANGEWKALFRKTGALLIGAGIPLGGTAVYFVRHQAFAHLIDQMFTYNLLHSATSFENRIVTGLVGLASFVSFGLVIIVLAGWTLGWLQIAKKTTMAETWRPLVHLALIGLPIELFLASLSGFYFAHYYMALLPMFALLTGYFIYGLQPNLVQLPRLIAYAVLFCIFYLAINKASGQIIFNLAHKTWDSTGSNNQLVAEIRYHADAHDYLLMWGSATTFNFLTEKESSSRFVYQYPLFVAEYAAPEMVAEFIEGMEGKRPLIIDVSATNLRTPPLDSDRRVAWLSAKNAQEKAHIASLEPIFNFIGNNYALADVTTIDDWRIYTYVGGS